MWVRTSDRRETTWTLFGGAFQTRQGHVVSTIGRPLPDGTSDVLVAYNHTTDQLEMFAIPAYRRFFLESTPALTRHFAK